MSCDREMVADDESGDDDKCDERVGKDGTRVDSDGGDGGGSDDDDGDDESADLRQKTILMLLSDPVCERMSQESLITWSVWTSTELHAKSSGDRRRL